METTVRTISKCTIKPASPSARARCDLSEWDLAMLSAHYIQKGLLFHRPPLPVPAIADALQTSLSVALRHFPPLAGRLVTEKPDEDDDRVLIYIDCNDTGAEFTRAVADGASVADVLTPRDVPDFVKSFFTPDAAVNHDGHTLPLLSVQLTELVDGVFVGCSFNHVVGDGTSFWHFFNAWAEICRAGVGGAETQFSINRPPVLERWFIDGNNRIKVPFTDPDKFIERFSSPVLRERIFHFSSESIAALKAKAKRENSATSAATISSFQSLCALVWRCIARARGQPCEQKSGCRLAIENRSRLRPRLSADYFGNAINAAPTMSTAGEVLGNDLGWAARTLNRMVAAHDDGAIRQWLKRWLEAPMTYWLSGFDVHSIMVGSSPRFDMYGCEFGWGRAVAQRSGPACKFDGKVSAYPGREGGGSVVLEICLKPEYMAAFEADPEFMSAVSVSGDV
ncbi:hypothetical protein QJS04_geneDACA001578 [Acorus gramineus]|uniref:Acetyltransferase n=1 Tax=Acorus gramineus TaxID=55184 RepID=A0AAV9BG95_ACOGR|nr:hypothetical protein QJS04_geneDACA001578 [Acorus gramineus]